MNENRAVDGRALPTARWRGGWKRRVRSGVSLKEGGTYNVGMFGTGLDKVVIRVLDEA